MIIEPFAEGYFSNVRFENPLSDNGWNRKAMIKFIIILVVFVVFVFVNTYSMMASFDQWAIDKDFLAAALFVAGTIWSVFTSKIGASGTRKEFLLKSVVSAALSALGLVAGFVAYCYVVFGMFKW